MNYLIGYFIMVSFLSHQDGYEDTWKHCFIVFFMSLFWPILVGAILAEYLKETSDEQH